MLRSVSLWQKAARVERIRGCKRKWEEMRKRRKKIERAFTLRVMWKNVVWFHCTVALKQ